MVFYLRVNFFGAPTFDGNVVKDPPVPSLFQDDISVLDSRSIVIVVNNRLVGFNAEINASD